MCLLQFVNTVTNADILTGPNSINLAGSPSPYGLWGMLGTRASKEVIDKEF